ALLANGIEAVVLGQQAPHTSLRVAVINDSDLHRASALVAELRPPKTGPLPSWWWHKRALGLMGAGFVLAYGAKPIAALASIPPVSLLLTSAAAFTIAFILLFLGYRADGRRKTDQSETP